MKDRKSSPSVVTRISTDLKQRQEWRQLTLLKKMPLHCNDFVTSIDRVVIKLKIVN